MKRFRFAALFLPLLLAGCTVSEPTREISVQTEKILVTLGDSISAGYGLTVPETERYSALLTQQLTSADQITWEDVNYAVSGYDTTDLIQQLEAGQTQQLNDADTVILYIGANNLLRAYSQIYLTVFEKEKDQTSQGLTAESVKDFLKRFADGVSEITSLQETIEAGISKLKPELETIYTKIRSENAEAPIYMMNIYNPYAKVSFPNPLNLKETFGAYAERMIGRCNTVLTEFAAEHQDIVLIDIAGAFASCETVPILGNINEGLHADQTPNVDPHPNPDGQKLIADTVFSAMRKP